MPPETRIQRTRVGPSVCRSPLSRQPLGGEGSGEPCRPVHACLVRVPAQLADQRLAENRPS